ncbi:JAB domain-containing protein [Sphingomonas sp. Y38-1Y]|uniref:JAB domain-containing protein n=1 Tax=Sphingomonas sp. Y38-1Y TaxID=3078265 RepID=UPI0028E8C391|nr:JAB domain-containing protein [Sphingomonas sp. Y38-1Y]
MAIARNTLEDLRSARAIFASIAHSREEIAAFAYLDQANRVIALRHTPVGSADAIELPIRTIAREALALEATGLVMAHNHPSRDVRPSAADIAVTRRFEQALGALGLKLIDHVILSADAVSSFRALGLL